MAARAMAAAFSVLALCAVTPQTARAALVLLDSFEAYSTGAIAPQSGGWWSTSAAAQATVGVDPTDPGNQVLVQGDGADQWIRFNNGAGLVSEGSMGTLFFRVYAPGGAHAGVALSPVSNATAWTDGKSILRIGETASNQRFYGINDGTYQLLTDKTQSGAWYNVWMVVDNQARQHAYYVQSDDDPDFASQTLVGPALGDAGALKFRQSVPDGSLTSILLRTGGAGQGVLYFDDFYIDGAAVNLAKPHPAEPIVVYREVFPNISDANDLPLSTAAWNSRWGGEAANVPIQQVARAAGSPTDALPVNSAPIEHWVTDYGYLVTHPGAGSYNGDPVLHWTEEYTIARPYLEVVEVEWRQRNNSPDDAARVAVRVGDDWFVSAQTFSNASSTVWALMRLKFGAATWLELDFAPGSVLALGGPAVLPGGDITGLGLFVDHASNTHRIDSFTILGALAVPEPSSVALSAAGGLCVALVGVLRRRRRQAAPR